MDDHPRNLLTQSLKLVHADLAHISKMVVGRKLPHTAANDLARYVKVLLDCSNDADDVNESERKKLSRIPTQELARMAEEAIASLKAK